jgi:uncharacterized protein (TIGR01777 family)
VKVAITGSTGLIGTALVKSLRADGHDVLRLVRRDPKGPDEARWDPTGDLDAFDLKALEGLDAVVHLAAAGVASRPWTKSYRRKVRDSRIVGTRSLAGALARLDAKPAVLVSASAEGYYGDTGGRPVTEDGPPGKGFLAELVAEWEVAAGPAAAAGIRVVHPRSGLVLTPDGGVLATMLLPFRLCLGARIGNGEQWMSWISIDDEIAALRYLIDHELEGPVNLTAPAPVTNAAFTKTLGRILHRPAVLVIPAPILRLTLGDLAREGVLISQQVLPGKLEEAGFVFRHFDLDTALTALLRK